MLDKLVVEYKMLLEESEQEQEELEQLREIRDMRQNEAKDYSERLRQIKNDNFNSEEKL